MGFEELILPAATVGGIAGAVVGVAYTAIRRMFVPVPPNRAVVLFGGRAPRRRHGTSNDSRPAEFRRPRIIVGGSAFIPPWSRGAAYLSLEPRVVDVTVRSLHGVERSQATGWEARLLVQVKIPADPNLLVVAAENLIGKSDEEVANLVRQIVAGAVPTVLAKLRPNAPEPDWERLASEIQASVAPDLVACGLIVRAVAITDLLRISPGEERSIPPPRSTPQLPPPSGEWESQSKWFTEFDSRLARVESNTLRLGGELGRMGRGPVFDRGRPAPARLGYGARPSASATILEYSEETSLHSPPGGDPSARSASASNEVRNADEEGPHRPRWESKTKR